MPTFRTARGELSYRDYEHSQEYQYNFLRCQGFGNNAVFQELLRYNSSISNTILASRGYGYQANGGDWPECNWNDPDALYRLTAFLKCLCYKQRTLPAEQYMVYVKDLLKHATKRCY